jgi:hypothetical protein
LIYLFCLRNMFRYVIGIHHVLLYAPIQCGIGVLLFYANKCAFTVKLIFALDLYRRRRLGFAKHACS